MISRISRIGQVGTFINLYPEERFNFGRLTLIYGDNGVGKSTLSTLLKAMFIKSAASVKDRASRKQNPLRSFHFLLRPQGN